MIEPAGVILLLATLAVVVAGSAGYFRRHRAGRSLRDFAIWTAIILGLVVLIRTFG